MIRLAQGLPALLLRACLALSLALTPLGHVLAAGDRALPAPQESLSCHHQDGPAQQDEGGCCHYQGSQCHCATAATLPATPLTAFGPQEAAPPLLSGAFCLHTPSTPETPPPRS